MTLPPHFRIHSLFLILLLGLAQFVRAENAAFDLPGPSVSVRVTRAGKNLPISAVPNLQPGDRVWVHPELPTVQSVHYLLIAAFLRGATNPPPENWFTRAETWSKKVREEGIVLTVPDDAEQLLLFLAPETGGDFSSLRSAVRGKPGAFVRAAQDLNQASLDRLRLDAYLDAVRKTSDTAPETLHDRSVLLARSLSIKLDHQCFDKPSEQQAPCLMQNTDQLVMEDGHSQSMVTALTSGASSDLIGQLSTTRVAGGGLYSPYVGVIVDLARMMESFRTAGYQYIPALALPRRDELNLRLNNPPSFRKPMSVIVIGLPAIEKVQKPPMRAVAATEVLCLQKPSLVLPVEGAPLVFSTGFARDAVLRLKNKAGQQFDLPAVPDATRGGFLVDTQKLQTARLDLADGDKNGITSGTIAGKWGFDSFDGPTFRLLNSHPSKWTVAPADQTALIVGRDDTLHLQADAVACVDQITIKNAAGKEIETTWKESKEDRLELQVSLKNETAGPVSIRVKQFGRNEADEIPLKTYSEVGHIESFTINAGDAEARLQGTRLDEVASLQVNGIQFAPSELVREGEKDSLRVSSAEVGARTLKEGEKFLVHVNLKDGRSLDVPTTILPSRPKVMLMSKSAAPGTAASVIRLGSENELSQDGRLSFFLKTETPAVFPRNEKIEVASEDESFHVLLNLDEGSLVLQDSQSVMAQLDPLKSFGPSAFGPLRFRAVQAGGRNGDWQPLTTLVRVPSLSRLHCAEKSDKECTLTGTRLFLIDSIASDEQFKSSVSVPLGFRDGTINVPRPTDGILYLKLRDDPTVVSVASLPENSRAGDAGRAGTESNSP